jgi:hypothetical protein
MDMSLTCLKHETSILDPVLNDAKAWFDRAAQSDVGLIYHADPDGAVSAALVSAFFAQRFGRPLSKRYWVGTHEFDFVGLSEWVLHANAKYIALFDVNIIENTKLLSEWSRKGIRLLIYDDHDVDHIDPPDNVTYLTPSRLAIKRPIPPSLFATILEGSLQPQHITCASIAVIGEHLAEEYSDLLAIAPLSRERLDALVRMVVAFYLCGEHDREDMSLRFLEEILMTPILWLQNTDKSVTASALTQIRFAIDNDVSTNLEGPEHWTNKKEAFEVFLKQVEARTRVVGLVASNLRDASNRGISIAYQDLHDRIIVEARRTTNLPDFHLVTLLKTLTRDVPILNLGGHPVAAGAAIQKAGRQHFLDNIYKWIKGWGDENET